MFTSDKEKHLVSTSFSNFVRNASSSEKKRVFTEVLKKSSLDQKSIIDKAPKLKK